MTKMSTTQASWSTGAIRKPRKPPPRRADDEAASLRFSGQRWQAPTLTGISLFTGGGVGDLALRAAGVDVLVASELLADRAEVYRANYPESEMIVGDVCETKVRLISQSRHASIQTFQKIANSTCDNFDLFDFPYPRLDI